MAKRKNTTLLRYISQRSHNEEKDLPRSSIDPEELVSESQPENSG